MNGGKARGCGGSRTKGGIYMECGSEGGFGIPMYMAIKDPIVPFDPENAQKSLDAAQKASIPVTLEDE